MQSLVSIVMCVYNAGPYLRAAVEGVLSQSYQNWELLIVDDGSTDACVATIRDITDPRIRHFCRAHGGKPRALNFALSEARGVFYAVSDADDVSLPQRVERQVECLLRNPDVAGVFCGYSLIVEGRVVAPTFREKSREECAEDVRRGDMPGLDPTAMYRLDLVRDIRYAEDLPVVEGVDYVLRIGEHLPFLVLGECLYSYRIVPSSVTRSDPGRRDRLRRVAYERMCERRGHSPKPPVTCGSSKRDRTTDDAHLVSHFTTSVADQVTAGHRVAALTTGWTCWRTNPKKPLFAKPLVYATMPASVIRGYRAAKEVRRRLGQRDAGASGSRHASE